MNAFQNTTVVVAGTAVATGLTSLNQLLQGQLSMKPILGGFVTGVFLLTIAFFSTTIAAALALLLLITSILTNGPAILAKVSGFVS